VQEVEMTALGQMIKDAREAKGWTRARLAVEMETSEATVRNWEGGRNTPPMPRAARLCRLLRLTAAAMLHAAAEQ